MLRWVWRLLFIHCHAAVGARDSVGTEWEAYAVVMMISLFMIGIVITLVGITE